MNEEISRVKVVVINSNTGHIVRSEVICTGEPLLTIIKRYRTKDSIVIALLDNIYYCFYIKNESYIFSTSVSVELIEFFKDVLAGLYDNARDSFHSSHGKFSIFYKEEKTWQN